VSDPISTLSPAARTALVEHLAVLRHDLGKYVSLQVRWSDGDPAMLREALTADLLETRRGPSGTSDAAEIWDGLVPELRGERPLSSGDVVDLRGWDTFDRLVAAMDVVRATIAALRTEVDDDGLRRGAEAAGSVAELCRELWRRASMMQAD
jgi:hypothetical protein